jgi:hypothetical protein
VGEFGRFWHLHDLTVARHPPPAKPAAQQFQDDVGIVVIVLDLDTSVRGIEMHGGDPVLTAELILDRVEALGAVRVVQLDEGSHR